MKMSICKTFGFDAAHRLPYYEGKCFVLHGHSWVLEVEVSGTPILLEGPKVGMVMDFGDLKTAVQREVIDRLDHTLLNDTISNPTAENILMWIWNKLRCLPFGMLSRLRLYETRDSFAELRSGDGTG